MLATPVFATLSCNMCSCNPFLQQNLEPCLQPSLAIDVCNALLQPLLATFACNPCLQPMLEDPCLQLCDCQPLEACNPCLQPVICNPCLQPMIAMYVCMYLRFNIASLSKSTSQQRI